MLNKRICISCANKHSDAGMSDEDVKNLAKWGIDPRVDIDLEHIKTSFLKRWRKDDDRDWMFGEVLCRIIDPISGCVQRAKVNSAPPSHCPYLTEHIVSMENYK
jgi:hypothetical protein